ncbi:sugar phosphate isomerase/epimerase family protein [Eisenbergiella sp.]
MIDTGMPTLIELPEIEDCAALCSKLGLQFVELNMNLPQYQTISLDAGRLGEAAEKYGIYFTIHLDENLNVSDFNPFVAQAYTRTVLETIHIARRLNVPVLNMHLSEGVYFTLPDRKVFLYEQYREQYLQSIRLFRETCEHSIGPSSLKICIENSSGYTDFQLQALELLLGSPAFALTFDIGHDHCINHKDEPVIISRSDRLYHFHFHDATAEKNHLPLGTGEIDLHKYLRFALQCHARVVLETKTVEGLERSAGWMKAHLMDA